MKNGVAILLFLVSCSGSVTDPQKIIDKSIAAHGGDKFLKSRIEFDFRDRHYVSTREGGAYTYERIFNDSLGQVRDVLTNDGFYREINGSRIAVADTMAAKYTRSVNSVIYFALLPYGLNDPAVRKKFLHLATIENQPYYKIEISFVQEGGGEDYSDVFHYWIHQKKFTIDYFAYSYHTDGGGIRFRKAQNPRLVNGILFQDYINYEPPAPDTKLEEMEELFKDGKLKELSRIELLNVQVK